MKLASKKKKERKNILNTLLSMLEMQRIMDIQIMSEIYDFNVRFQHCDFNTKLDIKLKNI